MKKAIYTFSVLLIFLIFTACSGNTSEINSDVIMDETIPPGAENAFVVELEFSADQIIPDRISVPADTDILFVIFNSDTKEGDINEDHNLVGPEIGLSEILVVPGQTVRRLWHSYDIPGEYRVGCTIHPWINMTIVIE